VIVERPGGCEPDGAHPPIALAPDAGIAAAARLVTSRPARLGHTRLVAVDGPTGSGKTSLAAPLASAIAGRIGGDVIHPVRSHGTGTVAPVEAGTVGPSPTPSTCSTGRSGTGADGGALDVSPPERSSPPTRRHSDVRPSVAVVSTDLLATWEHPLDWWPLLDERLLAPLAAGIPADLPVVQWVSGNPRPGGSVHVPQVDVLVLEGVSSGRAAVTDRLTALVWVEVAGRARRLERAVGRDGEAMRPFLARWQHDEDAHFRADRTRDRADVVITPL
jgi:uridine kinase